MRGSIVKRSRHSWSFVLERERDATGKRRQKWVPFKPTARHTGKCAERTCSDNCRAHAEAEAKLADLIGQLDKGTFVEATRTTLVAYLRDWLEKSVKPTKRPETYRVYRTFIETHIAAARLAQLPLQKVRKSDIENFYNVDLRALSPSSVTVCHAVLSKAMRDAVDDGILQASPAERAQNRRRIEDDASVAHAEQHCWSAAQAGDFLAAADAAGPQVAAFFRLALDCGARKSELLGLAWDAIDLTTGTVTISRQLDKAGPTPVFGPLKTKRRRKVTLNAETIQRLKAHRAQQRELRMANRTTYTDCGLVFAREQEHLQRPMTALGQPCPALAARHFQQVTEAAGVRVIKFHGLRHTCATLSLQAGVPVHAVKDRLGHADASMTLNVYGHVLPDMQQDAADRLGALLRAAGDRGRG